MCLPMKLIEASSCQMYLGLCPKFTLDLLILDLLTPTFERLFYQMIAVAKLRAVVTLLIQVHPLVEISVFLPCIVL